MKKAEFMAALQTEIGGSKKDASVLYNGMMIAIRNALKAGKVVPLSGVGSLRVTARQAKVSVNPRTKERIMVPEKLGITYTANEQLLRDIREDLPLSDFSK